MVQQGIAAQILNKTPSQQAPVTNTESGPNEQTTTPEPKPGINDFDERFGVLTKMERKIKELEAQNKAKAKEWEDKQGKYTEYEELIRLADENPLEFLKKKKGWGVQEFNEFAVSHGTDEDLDPVANMTKTFQQKIDELNKSWEEKLQKTVKEKADEIQNKDYERQIVEFKGSIKSFLAENKDAFEFIHAEEGGQDAVYDLIYQDIIRQQEAGTPDDQLQIMDIKDAAEKVESFLDTQYSKYLSLKKVQSKFNPSNEANVRALITKPEVPKTLDSSFSPKSKSQAELSEQERKQQAAQLVRSWRASS